MKMKTKVRTILKAIEFSICRTPFLKTRCHHTQSYSPTSITAALTSPSAFTGVEHVLIDQVKRRDEPNQQPYKLPEPWNPVEVFRALNKILSIKSVTVDMNNLIFHSRTTEKQIYYREDEYPEDILDKLDYPCDCTGLCQWTLDLSPKTTIQHFPSRRALEWSMLYKHNPAAWKAFVGALGNEGAEYKAFDFTAEFHSRDFCSYTEGDFVDLGPVGSGSYCGLASLSMQFACDMEGNTEYFLRHPNAWKPDLYRQIMDSKRGVGSTLQ